MKIQITEIIKPFYNILATHEVTAKMGMHAPLMMSVSPARNGIF